LRQVVPFVFHGRALGSGAGTTGVLGMVGAAGVVLGIAGITGAAWPATGAAGEMGAAGGCAFEVVTAGVLLRATGCDIGTSGVAALPVLVGITEPLPAAPVVDPVLLLGSVLQPSNADITAKWMAVLTAHSPAKGLERTVPACTAT
jgi:hypothetical protein